MNLGQQRNNQWRHSSYGNGRGRRKKDGANFRRWMKPEDHGERREGRAIPRVRRRGELEREEWRGVLPWGARGRNGREILGSRKEREREAVPACRRQIKEEVFFLDSSFRVLLKTPLTYLL